MIPGIGDAGNAGYRNAQRGIQPEEINRLGQAQHDLDTFGDVLGGMTGL